MDSLIRASSPRPFYFFEFAGIGRQDEPIFYEDPMEDIFDRVLMLPLILHSLEFFPIIPKKECKFDLEAASVSLLWFHY